MDLNVGLYQHFDFLTLTRYDRKGMPPISHVRYPIKWGPRHLLEAVPYSGMHQLN